MITKIGFWNLNDTSSDEFQLPNHYLKNAFFFILKLIYWLNNSFTKLYTYLQRDV